MNAITREKLLKAGFTESIMNGFKIYTRDGFSILHNNIAWCPCNTDFGKVTIQKLYLNTMEQIEHLILQS